MAAITLTQAQAQLDVWIAANTAVASGQSYTISAGGNSRTLTRVHSAEILKQIDFWNGMVIRLSRADTRRTYLGVPNE